MVFLELKQNSESFFPARSLPSAGLFRRETREEVCSPASLAGLRSEVVAS